ncbi:MAG: amidase family protein, partial [Myxococcota bacterium]
MKDNLDVRGVDTTCGYSRFCLQPAEEDSLLVKGLRLGGGVILCKTNVMQTLKAFECRNPIFGTTLHPLNPKYSSGGSSGGEAALVKACGSTIGIGSDDGGSIRLPSHFCGLCGLKPSSLRLPQEPDRVKLNNRGNDSLKDTVGPIARSVEDLELVFKTLTDQRLFDLDRSIVPVPFRAVSLTKKKVGYFVTNGLMRVTPACERAVRETVAKLRDDAGYDVEEIEFPRALEATTKFMNLASLEAYRRYRADLTNDPVEFIVKPLLLNAALPDWLKAAVSWLLKVIGRPEESAIIGASRSMTFQQAWNANAWRSVYATQLSRLFADYDFVVCPVNVNPAIKHGSFVYMPFSASYT